MMTELVLAMLAPGHSVDVTSEYLQMASTLHLQTPVSLIIGGYRFIRMTSLFVESPMFIHVSSNMLYYKNDKW